MKFSCPVSLKYLQYLRLCNRKEKTDQYAKPVVLCNLQMTKPQLFYAKISKHGQPTAGKKTLNAMKEKD